MPGWSAHDRSCCRDCNFNGVTPETERTPVTDVKTCQTHQPLVRSRLGDRPAQLERQCMDFFLPLSVRSGTRRWSRRTGRFVLRATRWTALAGMNCARGTYRGGHARCVLRPAARVAPRRPSILVHRRVVHGHPEDTRTRARRASSVLPSPLPPGQTAEERAERAAAATRAHPAGVRWRRSATTERTRVAALLRGVRIGRYG